MLRGTKSGAVALVLLAGPSFTGLPGVGGAGAVQPPAQKLIAPDFAPVDLFGAAVASFGNLLVIGADRDDDNGPESGSVYVFARAGSTWALEAKLTALDAAAGDYFGSSVAVSGKTILVGARQDRAGVGGAAYVFARSGSSWVQQAKLTGSDSADGDLFGYSVAISGNSAVIGAPLNDSPASNSGSAYVFLRSGATWVQQAKLTASDGAANDSFGEAVSLSETTVVAGALRDEADSGSAYVFVRSGSTWVQQAKLTANDGSPGDGFGDALVVLGDDVVIGAPFDDPSGTFSGSAYLFRRSGVAWVQTTKLVAGDGAPGDIFGRSVGISVENLVIGAPAELGDTDGSAYLYSRLGTGWSSPSELVAPEATIGDNYGSSVALSARQAVVGAPYDGGAAGSAYVFSIDEDT